MAKELQLRVNKKMRTVTAPPETPLLYVLTDELALQGPRFGCGLGSDGKWNFFVEVGMYDVVNVVVATSPSGHLYLKTEMDADTPDQLLLLPECQ